MQQQPLYAAARSTSAVAGRAPAQTGSDAILWRAPHGAAAGSAEILFVDPATPDVATLLAHLRPGIEAVVLDPRERASAEIARRLGGRRGLAAVHIVAHGAPGRVCFSSGDWTRSGLEGAAGEFAAIGRALSAEGELRLWSCETAAGGDGEAFVLALAEAAGAAVAASAKRVGAAALGGSWALEGKAARAPLTAAGVKSFSGVLVAKTWIGPLGSAGAPTSGNWNTSGNWSPSGVPATTDTVTLGGSNAYTVTLNVTTTITSLTISDASATLSLSNNLTLSSTGTSLSNAGAINLNALQLSAAGNISNAGSVTMTTGGLLRTTGGGASIANAGAISGAGTVTGSVTGSGSITASNGTLVLSNSVASGQSFVISSAAASTLQFNGAATAAAAIAINSANQTLAIGASGALTINAAESITNGKITLAGGTLTDSAGLTVGAGATLSGAGTVASDISGSGTLTASGGTLTLSGVVSSGPALTIASAASSNLSITGTATAAAAISFGGSASTLTIGAAGALTIGAAQTVTAGAIALAGGTLTDSSGLTLNGGSLSGNGTVAANLAHTSGTSAITATGGTLNLNGTVASGLTYTIAASGTLQFNNAVTVASSAFTFSGATSTLAVGASGALTVSGALSVASGVISLQGGTFTDSSTVTLGGAGSATGLITGFGTVAANIARGSSNSVANITASGGTLELTGTAGTAGSSLSTLTIGAGANDSLLLDGASYATSATFSGSSGVLEINTSGALTLTNQLAIGANALQLDGTGVQITDSGGFTLAGGSISGTGSIAAANTISGYGTISAPLSGHTGTITANNATALEIASGFNNVTALAISAASKMLLDGASSATGLTFGASGGTLELNSSGTLTLTNALTVGANTVKLDGASSTLTASSVSLTTGTITGQGKVAAAISATNAAHVTATGGTLEVTGAITNTGSLALSIGSGATDKLLLDGASAATSASFSGSTGTLELNTSGTLTLANALAVGANTLKLDGASSTLTASSVSLTTGTITGQGKVAGAISASGAAHVTASGGTLEVTGAITNTGSLALSIGSGATDKLLLDGASAATSASFSGSTGTLEINTAGSLTLANTLDVGANTLKLDGSGTKLTDAAGVTLAGGVISGTGAVAAATSLSGYGTLSTSLTNHTAAVTASGGTLEVTGAFSGASSLAVGTGASDKLLVDAAGSATSLTFQGSTGTLEIGASGSLTLTNALALGANTLQLDGAASTLTDANGVTLAGGTISGAGGLAANTNLSGFGTVAAPLSSANTVTATGGVLEFTGAVDATAASNFQIANVAGSVLKFDGAVGTSAIHPNVVFLGADGGHGALDLTGLVGGLANFHATVSGFDEGDGIKIANAASASLNGTSSTLTVYDASNTVLGAITLAGSYAGDAFDVSGGVVTVNDLVATLSSHSPSAGATITVASVTDDGAAVSTGLAYQWNLDGVAIFGANGASYTPVAGDVGGALSVTVTYTETSGSESTTVSAGAVGHNTTPPVVTIISAAEASNQANQTISGTVVGNGISAVVGQTITLSDNGVDLATTTVQNDGSFSFDVTLPNQGANSLVASVTDSDGNLGTSAAVVDLLDSVAPTIAITSPAKATNQAGQTIAGTVTSGGTAAVVGRTVTLSDNGVDLATTTVQNDGSFSFNVTLPNQGANSLVASVTDSYGNVGTSAAVVDTLDSVAPTIAITSLAEASNQASQTIAGTVTNDGTASVVGQTVTLTDNGVSLATTTVQNDGSFSFNVTLPNQGANSLVASVTDSYGNVGTSAPVVDTLDSVAPTIAITSLAEASNQASQTIAGTVTSGGTAAVVGQTVTLTDNGAFLASATVQADGTFSVDVTLAHEGSNLIVASVSDSYGNLGTSAGVTDLLDSIAPTIAITSPAKATNQASQTIAGTVTSGGTASVIGQTVTLTDNGVFLAATTVQADGSFSFNVTLPNQGDNALVASVSDSYGNSATSAAVHDLLDTIAPTVAITSPPVTTDQAVQTIAGTVTNGGTASVVGQTVTLTDNGVFLASAVVQADGSFSVGVTLPNQGDNSIVATLSDSYGNSATSAAVHDVLDSVSPTISLSGLVNGAASANRQVVATVNDPFAPPASQIQFTWTLNGSVVASGLGLDTFMPTAGQVDGTLAVSVGFDDTYGFSQTANASAGVVTKFAPPDHVVVLSLENEDYSAVVGDPLAPYLNYLAAQGMLLTNHSGMTHPSQPNYIALFSGSLQGVDNNVLPAQFPANVPTLASALAARGYSFNGYAETQTTPAADLVRQPWLSFANSANLGLDFSLFPQTAGGFANLPTVSFITPNDKDNMTPLSDNGGGVAAGDAWVAANLAAYIAWAQQNNSLLIITFDENNTNPAVTYPDHIGTIVVGAGVPAGARVTDPTNTYSLLASIQKLYGLDPIGETATSSIVNFYSSTSAHASSTFVNMPQGISDPTNYPPQNSLAVGPDYVIAGESSKIQWTNRATNQTTTESLYTLFANAPNASTTLSLLDSRALYDSTTGLYVLSAIEYDTVGGQINIEIATTTDPSQGWNVSTLLTGSTSTDMPGLAVGQGNIYIPSQVAGGETDTYVVPLSAVVNGATLQAGVGGVVKSANVNNGSFYAVSGNSNYTYLLAAYTNSKHTNLTFQTYNAAAGQFSATQTILLNNYDAPSNGGADFVANQAGTSAQLDAGSRKIASLAYASIGGRDYVYGVSEVQPTDAPQPEFEWFQLDVTNATDGVTPPAFVQGGNISPASLGFSSDVAIFNPSIAVNAAGDVLLNFSASGASMDPAAYYIVAGPNQSFGAPTLYQSSNGPMLSPLNSSGLVRWGAYSSAVADPTDPNGFWISNEYVDAGLPNNFGEPGWWSTVTSHVTVAPVVPPPGAPTITGPVNGALTNQNEPTITGTGVAGDKIKVKIDGVVVGTTIVASNGGWSFKPSSPVSDGPHAITAIQTNSGGASPVSNAVGVTIDTFVAKPVLALDVDSGVAGDGVTNNGKVDVTLAADVASWAYSTDNGATWTAGTGASFTLTGDGLKSVLVQQTDAAGNTATSDPFGFTLDTGVAKPVLALDVDSGVAGDGVTNNGKVDVTLAADVASWAYSTDNGATWTAGTGASFTLTGDGLKSVLVQQTDAAGNTATSDPFGFTLDTGVAKPVLALDVDSGVAGDGVTNNGKVDVTLAADVASWAYSTDNGATWTAGTGASFTLTGDGLKSVLVQQTDAAGNTATSDPFGFTLDTGVAKPVLALDVDSGVAGDGVTNNGKVDVTLAADVASWAYSTDNGATWTAGTGASFTLTGDGLKSVLVQQTDAAGNTATSDPFGFTLDTGVAKPVLALDVDSGVAGDGVTNNGKVDVTLAADVASWAYSTDNGATWTAGTGASFTLTGDGLKSVLVQQTDAAGNTTTSDPFGFTLDTGVAKPVLALDVDSGVAGDGVTNNGKVDVTLAADVASWAYSTDNGATWTAGTGASFTLTGDGLKSVLVQQTDAAGNTTTSDPFGFTLDTGVAKPVLALDVDSGVAGDGVTNNGKVDVTLAADVASWAYSTDNGATWTAGTGASFTLTGDGLKSVLVQQTDAAGNTTTSDPFGFTLDTGVAKPVLALDVDSGVAGDGVTNNGKVDVTLAADVASWAYSTDNGATWTAGTGASFTLTGDGLKSVLVQQTDAAGNTATSDPFGFTLDTGVAKPVLALDVDSGVAGDGVTNNGKVDVTLAADVASWAYSTDNGATWTAGTGASFTLTGDGLKSVLVQQTDAAGNTATSDPFGFTLDTGVAKPVLALDVDSGVAGDGVTNNGKVDVTLAADVASWAYSTDNGATWTAGTGASFTLTGDGLKSVLVQQTDAAGNTTTSDPFGFTLDTGVAKPVLALDVDSGVAGDGVTNNGKVDVTLAADVASWAYSTDNGATWTAGTGASFTLTGDGLKSVLVQQTDAAGNTATSDPFGFTLDTGVAKPVLALDVDSGVAGDGVTNNGKVDVTLAADVASWAYSTDNGATWTAGTGASFTLTGDGLKSVLVQQTDAAGNTATSDPFGFTLDTGVAKPVLALDVDSGVAGDGVTNNGKVDVTLAADVASWAYSTDNGATWTAGTGASFTLTGDGLKSVLVQQTDAAGNTATSDPFGFTLDTGVAKPVLALDVDSGVAGDGVTNNGKVDVTLAADVASWAYSTDNGATWTAGTGASFTLTGDGLKSVLVQQTDAAGNTATSDPFGFTLDTGVAKPVLALDVDSGVAGDGVTNNGKVDVTLAADVASWAYSTDNGATWTAGTGASFTLTGDGLKSVLVQQTDAAGNTTTSDPFGFTLDTGVAKPVLALDVDSGVAGDGVTNNGKVDVTLAADVASWAYSTDNGATWTAGTGASFTLTGDGLKSVLVQQTDAAGNTTTSDPFGFTLDTGVAKPVLALDVDSGVAGDGVTNNGKVDVTLAADVASWAYSTDNGATWTAGTGASFTLTGDGLKSVLVQQTDAAGNTTTSDPFGFTLDTGVAKPVLALDVDSGVAGDGVTNNGKVDVTLAADVASWAYSTDNGATWTAGTGASFTLTGDGLKSVLVQQTDAAGNTATSDPFGFTLDTGVAKPVLALDVDSGVAGDGVTNNGKVDVTLAADVASWAYSTDNGATWTAGTGASFTLTGDGLKSVLVQQTDAAGNTATSDPFGFTLDTGVAKPVLALDVDSGVAGDGVTNNGKVDVTLAADVASWAYSTDNGATWTAGTGASFTLTGDGLKSVLVQQTDAAGNTTTSDPFGFTLDTGVAKPVLALDVDSGVAGDGVTNNGKVDVTLAADVASWAYSTDNGATWTAGTGASFTLTGDGLKSVLVQQTDAAGNTATSDPFGFTLDTGVAKPVLALDVDSGVAGDGVTNNGKVDVTLAADVASWAYSTDNGATWTAGTGASFTLTGDGLKSVLVQQTDAAGNTATSDPFGFTLDTGVAKPVLALDVDSGVAGDGVTNNGKVDVTLAADVASWAYSTDNGATWTAGTGASFTLTGDGLKSVLVQQTDAAGNTATSDPFGFTLDTGVAKPVLALDVDSGVAGDGVTNNGKVDVTLAADVASWAYSTDNGATWTAGTGASFTLTGDGLKSVLVQQTDAAGNTTTSDPFGFTLDTGVAKPVLALDVDSGVAGDGVTNNGKVDVTLAADVASWAYSTDNGATWTAGTGASFTLTGDGLKSVLVQQTDAAGNTATSDPFGFTLDTGVPAAPAITNGVYNSTQWTLSGTAEPNAAITVYDGGAPVASAQTDAGGAWSLGTGEDNSVVRVFTVVATDQALNSGPASQTAYLGTPGSDIFSFASESALSAVALLNGSGGDDTLLLTGAANLTDADFAHIVSIETLGLTGVSSVTLGANAYAAGIAAIALGGGAESIADSNPGALKIDGGGLGAGHKATLSGSSAMGVTNLTGDLDASATSGALSVVTTGTAPQTILTGSANATITNNGAGAVINATKLATASSLTLAGTGPVTVQNITGSLLAGSLANTLTATLTGSAKQSVTLSAGDSSITDNAAGGGTLNAAKTTAGHTVTLIGSAAETVFNLGANLNAANLTGALTAILNGTATQSITLGSANASVTNNGAGAVIDATKLATASTLTLAGTGPVTVQNMTGSLFANSLTNTLTATLTGSAKQSVTLSAGDSSITDNAAGGGNLNAAKTTAGHTVTLIGSAAETVANLGANLNAANLTGALTATLNGTATQSITLGSANASVTNNGAGAVIDATKLATASSLTLAGTGPVTVQNITGSLLAGSLANTLTATLTGSAKQSVTLSAGDSSITDNAAGGGTLNAAKTTAGHTVTLIGSAAETVFNLGANLNAANLTGALTAILNGTATQSITLGSDNATVTNNAAGGGTLNAAKTTAGHTVTLIGSAAETVANLGANLNAANLTGALTATLNGTATQTILTGSANATITNNGAGAVINATKLATASSLTLAGTGPITVQNMTGSLLAGSLANTLTATLTGSAKQSVTLSAGDSSITDNAAGGGTLNAVKTTAGHTVTLIGSAAETVFNLGANLNAANLTGALTAILNGTATQSITLGSANASVTNNGAGAVIDPTKLATASTLTLAGTGPVTVQNMTGSLFANSLTNTLTATLTGSAKQNVVLGAGDSSITDNAAGGGNLNAAKTTAGHTVTLIGSAAETVANLGANLNAANLTGALTATLNGTATQSITLGSANASVTNNGAGAVIDATKLADGNTLTLTGAQTASVVNLIGNVTATSLSGALTVTTGAAPTIQVATGAGANVIHAEAMTAHEALTLTGSHNATAYLGGDLSALADTGALTIFTSGSGPHTIQTGSGADSVTAAGGGDAIRTGGGGDAINVSGHTSADTFVYSAIAESLNAAGKQDTITGFAASGAFHDLIDLSAINPSLAVTGLLSGGTLAAHSIGWTYSGGNAQVFVNNTGGALATSSASLMEINLTGVSSGLAASLFKA